MKDNQAQYSQLPMRVIVHPVSLVLNIQLVLAMDNSFTLSAIYINAQYHA